MQLKKRFFQVLLGAALAVGAIALTASATSPTAASLPKLGEQVLNLSQYQQPDGMLPTFIDGEAADPYFGLLSLELAQHAGMDTTQVEDRFIEWGLANQRADGRFDRYCRDKGVWASCGKADSDDATLSRWLQLLARKHAPAGQAQRWDRSFKSAEAVLFGLRMKNGIFSVFPHDLPGYTGYALFKDNVEVLGAFESIAMSMLDKGEHATSARYAQAAHELRAAMKEHFGDEPFALKTMALGAKYPGELFYPHKVALPFAWREGYLPPPTPAQWERWLSENDTQWRDFAEKDYPWGLIAVAAQATGRNDVAQQWLADYASRRETGGRWNVLEETAAQILAYRLKQAGVALPG